MSTLNAAQTKSASEARTGSRASRSALDVIKPAEWEKGHIPAVLLAPCGRLEWYADPTTLYAKPDTAKRDARIIVTCVSGGRSILATETLRKMGYTDVVNMAVGFNEWSKQCSL